MIEKTMSIKTIKNNMALFSIGKLISTFGSMIYTFAIGLYVLNLTGSSEQFAMTLVIGTLPNILLSPIAGVWLSKVSKLKVAIAVDVINGVIMLWLWFLRDLSMGQIYFSTLCINIAMVFYGIASEVLKPQIVCKDFVGRVNSISKFIDGAASVIAPMLGGFLILVVSMRSFVLFNGISFFLSAFLLLFVQSQEHLDRANSEVPFVKALVEGVAFLSSEKDLKKILLALISLNFYLGLAIEVPIPYILNQVFNVSARVYGIVMAGFPIGLILGVVLIEKMQRYTSLWDLLRRMNLWMGMTTLLMALPLLVSMEPILGAYYFILMTILGISIAFIDVPIMVYLQTEVPEALRSRVLGVVSSLVKIALPLSFILSGLLIGVLPIATLMFMGALIAFATQICLKN